ncbi:MAG: NADH-quinone oxidoreductase subunit M [Candidatus Bathyarchaeota archaeon]|nr:NADH-quinone oxidoreductase subunit M [Candidatus Bathyarchaeota archaeon]
MSLPLLLSVFAIPTISIPFVYLAGKKSTKAAAGIVAAIALINMALLAMTIPYIQGADHSYTETYTWIPQLNGTEFTLYVDGISVSVAMISLVLIFVAAIYSVNYMSGKKNLPVYYALLCMLSVGLIGVFLTSNMILFYFCWELMLVPAYFIVGEWGYRNSYKSALKLFIFTHAGAVFVLLGIGATYWLTGTTDMLSAQGILATAANSEVAKWILIALTGGFAVKMAVFPVHMWLPDAHSEAPAPMSALLSGVIISAGAYAILRLSFGMVFPSVGLTFGTYFLYALSIIGVVTAFFGSLLSLVANDIKRVIAYSSIAHMGYTMFGLSLFPAALASGNTVALASPIALAIVGTVLHIITHAASKGLFFLTAGGVMHQTEKRDIREMGGLAGKMPFSAVSGMIAALSIAGAPPLACFISEFFIFMGAFQIIQIDSFYIIPTALMLIATVFSLAYSLRFISKVFFGQSKDEQGAVQVAHDAHANQSQPEAPVTEGHGHKITDIPNYMKAALAILVVLVVLIGIYPTFFVQLIQTVTFGAVA